MSQVRILQRLFTYAQEYRWRLVCACLAVVLNTIFDLLPDVLIGFAVDVVVNQQDSWLAHVGVVKAQDQLLILVGAALIMWLLIATTEFLYVYLWRMLSQQLQHSLRVDAYKSVQQQELSYHEASQTGNLIAIINDDINQLERFFDYGAYKVLYLTTTLIVVASTFLYLSPLIALCALLPIPCILVTIWWFRLQLAPRYARMRIAVGGVVHRITHNLLGIATIKSYTAEDRELEAVREVSDTYRKVSSEAILFNALFYPAVRIVVVIAFTATVIIGGWQVLSGVLAVGAYSVLVAQVQKILWPALELADVIDLYERAAASLQRIFGLIDTPLVSSLTYQPAVSTAQQNIQGHVVFSNVSFGYQTGNLLIKSLNLNIPAGDCVALVGATGSGKSTIFKLLMRFYQGYQGSITIDGRELNTIPLPQLRKAIALVSQEVFIFQGTVFDNIAYGAQNVTHDVVIEAACRAQAHDFIMDLPQGYSTVVGYQGIMLSGGQRQRISMARALLKNAPILLLDEATSSVDYHVEKAIIQEIAQLRGHCTVIIITHRCAALPISSAIAVLDQGRIVQYGSHAYLAHTPGFYQELWRTQNLI